MHTTGLSATEKDNPETTPTKSIEAGLVNKGDVKLAGRPITAAGAALNPSRVFYLSLASHVVSGIESLPGCHGGTTIVIRGRLNGCCRICRRASAGGCAWPHGISLDCRSPRPRGVLGGICSTPGLPPCPQPFSSRPRSAWSCRLLARFGNRAIVDGHDRQLVTIGKANHVWLIDDDRPARLDRQARAPASIIVSKVPTPIVGTSKRMSCFGLATFTTVKPGAHSLPARRMHSSVLRSPRRPRSCAL